MRILYYVPVICILSFQLYAETSVEEAPKPRASKSAFEHYQWKRWLDRFAASTPRLADKKNFPSHFLTDDKYLDIVLAGNSKLQFEKPLFIGKHEHKAYDLFKSVEARRFEVFDQIDYVLLDFGKDRDEALKEEERNRVMRDHLIKLIVEREDGELLLVHTGRAHAYDLFFRLYLTPDLPPKHPHHKINSEVIYVGIPVVESTPFFTEDFENFVAASRGMKQETEIVKDHSLSMAASFLARLYYYNNLKHGLVSKESILKEHPVKLGTLIFMDTHYLRVEEPYKSMPGPQALREVGVKKIKVALEGWKAGKTYQSKDVERLYRVQGTKKYSKEDLDYFKKFRPKAYEIYQKNFITDLSVASLHNKLKSYEAVGIEVSYTGLEEFERF